MPVKSNSRDKILSQVRYNRPGSVEYPVIPEFDYSHSQIIIDFKKCVEQMGGTVAETIEDAIAALGDGELRILSPIEPEISTIQVDSIDHPELLESLDVAIIQGEFGVAENGAIWVNEKDLPHRILPFIAQHLIIVTNSDNLVANMHEAYNAIRLAETGFGVFIAGPSKTADIEQSLVIGAQGPVSHTVVLQ